MLINLTKPYTKCTIKFLSQELDLTEVETESLLVDMILDGQLNAHIDQLGGYVTLYRSKSDSSNEVVELLGDWAEALNNATVGLTFKSMNG